MDLVGRHVRGGSASHRQAIHRGALGQCREPVRGPRPRQVFLRTNRPAGGSPGKTLPRAASGSPPRGARASARPSTAGNMLSSASTARSSSTSPAAGASDSSCGSDVRAMTRGIVTPDCHALAHDPRRAVQVFRIAPQARKPRAIVGFVPERLTGDEADEVVGYAAIQLDEDVVLVKRILQPLERFPAVVGEELMRELFGWRQLARGNPVELLQHPAIVCPLPLAMLRRKRQLDLVLARPAPCPMVSRNRKEVSARS